MDVPIKPLPPQQPFVSRPIHERRGLMTTLTLVVVVALVISGFVFYRHYHPKAAGPRSADPQTLINSGDLDAALVQLNQILASNSSPIIKVRAATLVSLTLSQKGLSLFKESEYGAQAVTAANDALTLSATSSEAYRALGLADQIQQKYAEAHTAYQQAIVLDPKSFSALAGDAHTYELEGNLAQAEPLYKAALALYAWCYEADLGLGRIASARGKVDDALAYFQPVYTSAPNVHDRAQAAYAMGMLSITKYPTALNIAESKLKDATMLNAQYPLGWLGLGTVLYAEAGMKNVSADQRASLLSQSTAAFDKAVALITFDASTVSAHPQLTLDLSVVADTKSALAALAEYAAGAQSQTSAPVASLTALLKSVPATHK